MILRRLYLYVVSTAALILLCAGLTLLGGTTVLFVFNDPAAESSRGQLAIFTAMVVVAAPVWGVHLFFAQRFATRDPYERSSALRRLYLYFICLVGAIATTVALFNALRELLQPVMDRLPYNGETAAQFGWAAAVFAATWAFHFVTAARDRAVVGEEGAPATLRRWYMYPALLIGLLTMLTGTQGVLQSAWTDLVVGSSSNSPYFSGPFASMVAGAVLWGFHARVLATRHLAEDRHSTLRAIEGFLAVAISIATALVGASQILYYALARLLGVSNPGGAGNDVLAAAAGPGSLLLVYGVAWFLTQRRLTRDAGTQEAERQAGVRRLYTNLASLVALAVWATGGGGVLWTLAEQAEAPIIGVPASGWKDPLSLWITLLVVGFAVWLVEWRDAPWAADRQSLSRRLYVWAALLGSILGVLVGGVGMINALLQQVFSAHPALKSISNLDFGHFLAVILVAGGVGFYHWRVLRADAAARPPRPPVPAGATPAAIAAAVTGEAAAAATGPLGPLGHRYTLVVTDATEDDIHSALANLPPQAGYRLTSTEPSIDEH